MNAATIVPMKAVSSARRIKKSTTASVGGFGKFLSTNDVEQLRDASSAKLTMVYCDGSCRGNHKKNKRGVAMGYAVYWKDGHQNNFAGGVVGDSSPTNNRAELYAIIHALRQAKAHTTKPIVILSDNELALNAITTWVRGWEANGWITSKGTPVENSDLIKTAKKLLDDSPGVFVSHIRGKSTPECRKVDAMAYNAAGELLNQ